MKRRILTISLVVAALVLLVSVGFAGWVISQDNKTTATGNFDAYGVSETGSLQVYTVSSSATGAETSDYTTNIIFGYDGTPSPDRGWLTKESDVLAAQLDAYVLVKYTQSAAYDSSGKVFDFTHAFVNGLASNMDVLVGGPTYTVQGRSSDSNVLWDGTNHRITFKANGWIIIKLTYNFGSAFGSQNPYKFFNEHYQNDALSQAYSIPDVPAVDANPGTSAASLTTANTYRDLAFYALTALNELCKSLQFTVTVSAHTA